MTTLDELERLLKAGTPGPWKIERGKRCIQGPDTFEGEPLVLASMMGGRQWSASPYSQYCVPGMKDGDANAALIVAAINALPGLIEMARDYAKLNEPDGVLINMMRGAIPKVSANSLHKLYNAAEVSQAFPELRAVKAALEEIARHENTGLTGPGRQQADSCVKIARAALEGFNCG